MALDEAAILGKNPLLLCAARGCVADMWSLGCLLYTRLGCTSFCLGSCACDAASCAQGLDESCLASRINLDLLMFSLWASSDLGLQFNMAQEGAPTLAVEPIGR